MAKHTTRRTLLKAAPALLVAPAAVAGEPSDIMRRFKECVALFDALCTEGSFSEEGEYKLAADLLRKMEAELMAIPATTAEELAAKVHVWTLYGEDGVFDCPHDEAIIADIRRLIGRAVA